MADPVTIGRFTVDADLTIHGPAPYMQSADFAAWKRKLEAGNDFVFNASVGQGYGYQHALGVSVQTDFAAWMGTQTFLDGSAIAAGRA